MYYQLNKLKSRTRSTRPTLTDQSQARETDINVIVKRYGIGNGQAPGRAGEPMYGDFTQLPDDLRGFIETARTIEQHKRNLPKELRDMAVHDILALTPEQLTAKLTPPAPTPAPTGETNGETVRTTG